MQVSSSMANKNTISSLHTIKTNFTEKISKEEVNDLKKQIEENTKFFALKSTNVQGKLVSSEIDFKKAQFFKRYRLRGKAHS